MRAALPIARYLSAVLLTTQRWAPPALVLTGVIAWIWVTPPLGIDTVRVILPVLCALASWIGHVLGTIEDAGQESISISCAGSATRLLLTRWVLAAVLAATVPLLLVGGAFGYGLAVPTHQVFGAGQTVAGLLAIGCVAGTGAALGAVTAALLPTRPGWAAGALILLGLLQLTPWLAPTSQLAKALPPDGGTPGPDLLIGAGLAAIIGAALVALARLCHPAATASGRWRSPRPGSR